MKMSVQIHPAGDLDAITDDEMFQQLREAVQPSLRQYLTTTPHRYIIQQHPGSFLGLLLQRFPPPPEQLPAEDRVPIPSKEKEHILLRGESSSAAPNASARQEGLTEQRGESATSDDAHAPQAARCAGPTPFGSSAVTGLPDAKPETVDKTCQIPDDSAVSGESNFSALGAHSLDTGGPAAEQQLNRDAGSGAIVPNPSDFPAMAGLLNDSSFMEQAESKKKKKNKNRKKKKKNQAEDDEDLLILEEAMQQIPVGIKIQDIEARYARLSLTVKVCNKVFSKPKRQSRARLNTAEAVIIVGDDTGTIELHAQGSEVDMVEGSYVRLTYVETGFDMLGHLILRNPKFVAVDPPEWQVNESPLLNRSKEQHTGPLSSYV